VAAEVLITDRPDPHPLRDPGDFSASKNKSRGRGRRASCSRRAADTNGVPSDNGRRA
jgi:hypothetical protein